MKHIAIFFLVSLAAIVALPDSGGAQTQKLCIKKKLRVRRGARVPHRRALRVVDGSCPRGTVELLDTDSFRGDDGAQGPAGADASDFLFGNGSAGDLVISSDTRLERANLNFENVTIESGVTLTVSSGAVIRCTGTFSLAGTLYVEPFADGGRFHASRDGQKHTMPAPSYLSGSVAGSGECKGTGEYRDGGIAATGPAAAASLAQYIRLTPVGGGGGAGGATESSDGGKGGGTVTILCRSAISVSGSILAAGERGGGFLGGGGGGGIVLLGSSASITNTGTIYVGGGDGRDSINFGAASGGGGGGLVHLIAPQIVSGTVHVTGGAGGESSTSVTAPTACGGAAGGAGAGAGGDGADATDGDLSTAPGNGENGVLIQTEEDPKNVFGPY